MPAKAGIYFFSILLFISVFAAEKRVESKRYAATDSNRFGNGNHLVHSIIELFERGFVFLKPCERVCFLAESLREFNKPSDIMLSTLGLANIIAV